VSVESKNGEIRVSLLDGTTRIPVGLRKDLTGHLYGVVAGGGTIDFDKKTANDITQAYLGQPLENVDFSWNGKPQILNAGKAVQEAKAPVREYNGREHSFEGLLDEPKKTIVYYNPEGAIPPLASSPYVEEQPKEKDYATEYYLGLTSGPQGSIDSRMRRPVESKVQPIMGSKKGEPLLSAQGLDPKALIFRDPKEGEPLLSAQGLDPKALTFRDPKEGEPGRIAKAALQQELLKKYAADNGDRPNYLVVGDMGPQGWTPVSYSPGQASPVPSVVDKEALKKQLVEKYGNIEDSKLTPQERNSQMGGF